MTEQEEIDTLRLVSRFFAFSERGEPFKKTFNTNGERMTEQEEIDTLRSVSRVFAFSDRGGPFKKTFSFEGKTVALGAPVPDDFCGYARHRQAEYDRLAAAARECLSMDSIYAILRGQADVQGEGQ